MPFWSVVSAFSEERPVFPETGGGSTRVLEHLLHPSVCSTLRMCTVGCAHGPGGRGCQYPSVSSVPSWNPQCDQARPRLLVPLGSSCPHPCPRYSWGWGSGAFKLKFVVRFSCSDGRWIFSLWSSWPCYVWTLPGCAGCDSYLLMPHWGRRAVWMGPGPSRPQAPTAAQPPESRTVLPDKGVLLSRAVLATGSMGTCGGGVFLG